MFGSSEKSQKSSHDICVPRATLFSILLIMLLSPARVLATAPCCSIQRIDPSTAQVVAIENATGRTFTFKVANSALLNSLKVGQAVYANFATHQVSVDGASSCCSIVSLSSVATASQANSSATSPGANTVRPNAAQSQVQSAANMKTIGTSGISNAKPNSFTIPVVSQGTPQPVQATAPKVGVGNSRGMTNTNTVRLRGIDGIRTASGIPQGAKDFLLMHAKALPPGEQDNYVVNPQLAEEWFKAHPEPESVKQAVAKSNSHAGCNAISVQCAGEAAQHAAGEAERQSQKLIQEAQGEWNHLTHEVEHDWNMAEGCFADQTLTLSNIPVRFSVAPQFPMSFEKTGTANNAYGSASGTITGTVTFGVPMQSDFTAQVDMFYIPCLPFAVRPRSIAASGRLGVGSLFEATATATGKFKQTFTIPPTGGPHFPIEVIPIIVGGVPIAEMDVSVYVDGRIIVDGDGKFAGAVGVKTMQDTAFDFSCSGKACDLVQHSVPEPVSTTESARLEGRVHVKPEVYAALQLDFDVDLLTARAGPQPYLLGEIYGCAAAAATQSGGASASAQESYALTSDLDWGIELRAEGLAAGKKVAEKNWSLLQRHLYFKDLANSSALIPAINGSTQPLSGQPAVYTIKMPSCYPYSDPLEYQVHWTGAATASSAVPPNTPAPGNPVGFIAANRTANPGRQPTTSSVLPASCSFLSGMADCWSDPVKNTSFSLVWPSVGNFTVTATSMRDKHGRKFDSGATGQMSVSVQQARASSSTP